MANDAASRRDARRRRILENSEHRLQKITGRNDIIAKGNVTFADEEGSLGTRNGSFSQQTTNGPVKLPNSAAKIGSGCCNSEYSIQGSYSGSQSLPEPEHRNTPSPTSELSRHQETHMYTTSSLHWFYAARLHLICLAVLVRIMFAVNYGFVFGESLVTPLCLVEVTDILWLHISRLQVKPSPGLLGAVLLLSGISTHKQLAGNTTQESSVASNLHHCTSASDNSPAPPQIETDKTPLVVSSPAYSHPPPNN